MRLWIQGHAQTLKHYDFYLTFNHCSWFFIYFHFFNFLSVMTLSTFTSDKCYWEKKFYELPKLQDISDTNQSSSDNNSLGNSFQLVMCNMLILWEAQLKHCWAESSIRLLLFTSDNNWCHKNYYSWQQKLWSQDWQCTASPLLVKIYLLSHSTDPSTRALFFNVQQNNANRTEIQMYITE